jgi:hypothetical protein
MSVAPAFENPTRRIFNMNNFEASTTSYLGNKGKQRLIGELVSNNDTTLNDERVYGTSNVGTLIVENDASFLREPLINSITNSVSLTNNNLVSKKYVDDEILKVETNPYPIFFSFGSSYVNNTALDMSNASGFVKIGTTDVSKLVLTCVVEIVYHLTISSGETTIIDNHNTYTGTYLISYDKTPPIPNSVTINGVTTILPTIPSILSNPKYRLLAGTDMTTTSLPNTIPAFYPLTIGLKENSLAIEYNFPNGTYNKTAPNPPINPNPKWYSAYGISMRIIHSTPHSNTTNLKILSPSNDGLNTFTGSMYFMTN